MNEDLRYPIGKFVRPEPILPDAINDAIATLAEAPGLLRNAVEGLSMDQQDCPYRPEGWSVRELVHHIADSHMQAFARVRLALTEDWPTITPYNEKAWAQLHDSAAPIEWSLELVEALHARWVMLLQSLKTPDWHRGFVHPERGRMAIDQTTLLYAWHSRHHLAHITHLRMRNGW